MTSWAAAELSDIDVGDLRRERRPIQILEDLGV
jgi:Transposase DNA-binding